MRFANSSLFYKSKKFFNFYKIKMYLLSFYFWYPAIISKTIAQSVHRYLSLCFLWESYTFQLLNLVLCFIFIKNCMWQWIGVLIHSLAYSYPAELSTFSENNIISLKNLFIFLWNKLLSKVYDLICRLSVLSPWNIIYCFGFFFFFWKCHSDLIIVLLKRSLKLKTPIPLNLSFRPCVGVKYLSLA